VVDAVSADVTAGAEPMFRPAHRPVPEPPMTATEAVDVLAGSGFDRDQARAMVARYLDDTSRELGCSVHQWGLDEADLDDIVAHHADAHQHAHDQHDQFDADGNTDAGWER
jgi:hypothetical protein